MIFLKIKSVSKKSVILMEFDWVLFIATICLSVFGIVMIYSATNIAVEYECNSAVGCNGYRLCGNACNVFFRLRTA